MADDEDLEQIAFVHVERLIAMHEQSAPTQRLRNMLTSKIETFVKHVVPSTSLPPAALIPLFDSFMELSFETLRLTHPVLLYGVRYNADYGRPIFERFVRLETDFAAHSELRKHVERMIVLHEILTTDSDVLAHEKLKSVNDAIDAIVATLNAREKYRYAITLKMIGLSASMSRHGELYRGVSKEQAIRVSVDELAADKPPGCVVDVDWIRREALDKFLRVDADTVGQADIDKMLAIRETLHFIVKYKIRDEYTLNAEETEVWLNGIENLDGLSDYERALFGRGDHDGPMRITFQNF
ncbi:unnamed protein product [Caenorhabditis bovis]|uniref:Uncharacterized protein n=1 Tax=Caenorhabditis bovis TaxID=2654633 RepID=A0A8S1EM12_9PELO|nr:unnamed protein product [Caenorhabditis bovis]